MRARRTLWLALSICAACDDGAEERDPDVTVSVGAGPQDQDVDRPDAIRIDAGVPDAGPLDADTLDGPTLDAQPDARLEDAAPDVAALDAEPVGCAPGEERECQLLGRQGVQRCDEDGEFGACAPVAVDAGQLDGGDFARPDADPPLDAVVDAAPLDAARPDVPLPDVALDAAPPDVPALDAAPPDAAPPDVPFDAAPPDVPARDAAPPDAIDDAAEPDAARDVGGDVGAACEDDCVRPFAQTECVDDVCQVVACDEGFLDLDEDPTNGCERGCRLEAEPTVYDVAPGHPQIASRGGNTAVTYANAEGLFVVLDDEPILLTPAQVVDHAVTGYPAGSIVAAITIADDERAISYWVVGLGGDVEHTATVPGAALTSPTVAFARNPDRALVAVQDRATQEMVLLLFDPAIPDEVAEVRHAVLLGDANSEQVAIATPGGFAVAFESRSDDGGLLLVEQDGALRRVYRERLDDDIAGHDIIAAPDAVLWAVRDAFNQAIGLRVTLEADPEQTWATRRIREAEVHLLRTDAGYVMLAGFPIRAYFFDAGFELLGDALFPLGAVGNDVYDVANGRPQAVTWSANRQLHVLPIGCE